jgi:hypothetical protein
MLKLLARASESSACMLVLASAYETGQLIGGLLAIALFGALAIAFGRRALDRGRRPAATALPVSAPAAPIRSTAGSVAPPGFSEPIGSFTPAAPSRPRGGRGSRARTLYGLAAGVCAVLLVVASVRFADRHLGDGPWDTTQGRQLRAGFMLGCQNSAHGSIDCECMFEHLTDAPPYDTPAEFVAMEGTFERSVMTAMRTRDPAALPPYLLDAGTACVED